VAYGDLERLATQMSGMSCIVLAVLHKFVVTMTKQCADDLAVLALFGHLEHATSASGFMALAPIFAEYG